MRLPPQIRCHLASYSVLADERRKQCEDAAALCDAERRTKAAAGFRMSSAYWREQAADVRRILAEDDDLRVGTVRAAA